MTGLLTLLFALMCWPRNRFRRPVAVGVASPPCHSRHAENTLRDNKIACCYTSRKGRVMTNSRPLPVVAYLRVSTDSQAEHGVSLAAQRSRVQGYADLYDLELVAVIEDAGASAKSLDRTGLDDALALLRSGQASGLLVAKLDRLTRSVRDLGHLVEHYFHANGSVLLSVSEQIDTRSASGRLVLNVLTSVAQWEREVIGERTAAALAHKVDQGEYTGGQMPYGYRLSADGVHLEPEPAEQRIIDAAARAQRAGLSLRTIARELDRMGFRARSGRAFHHEQVRRMLAQQAA